MTRAKNKRSKEDSALFDRDKFYTLGEALELLKKFRASKFDETVEIHLRLGVDPKHSDQMVRGSIILPNGTGKVMKVLVFVKGEKEEEARAAGADYIGSDEYVEKIKGGWLDFDVAIATPDLMRDVGKLGRILGPRNLMPNPKTGTVTKDIAKAVKEFKAGKVEFKVDKMGNIHSAVGKKSFENGKLKENIQSFYNAVLKAKPPALKGQYIRAVFITTTMGKGIKINPLTI